MKIKQVPVKNMKIKQVPINSIKPAKYNPRIMTDSEFQGLKESLKKFGLVEPLIVNIRTGNLCGGHQRLKVLESLGYTDVPIVEVDLSASEEKALNITLNNTAIMGQFTDGLQTLIEEIKLDLGEDFLQRMRLDTLVVDEWVSNMDDLASIEENDEPTKEVIKIRCDKEEKDAILDWLKAEVKKQKWEVTIE